MSSQRRKTDSKSAASIHRLDGYLPRRLRTAQAAEYMGVSETTFLARVKEGLYPPPRKEIGATFWLRDDLDAYINRQFGVGVANDERAANEDPFAARFRKAS